eukprot:5248310-Alexandrium_andersonii.AAC.1
MSASLVGSEMCIRDRSRTTRHLVFESAGLARHRAPNIKYDSSAYAAVSYTHLTLPTICSV